MAERAARGRTRGVRRSRAARRGGAEAPVLRQGIQRPRAVNTGVVGVRREGAEAARGGLRAYCSCGWRAVGVPPIDWGQVAVDGAALTEESGPLEDWEQHVDEVDAAAAVVPPELLGMIEQFGA